MVCALAETAGTLPRRARDLRAQEILCPGNAALSFRRIAYGARTQLRHRRCSCALYVDEGLQRTSSYGMGRVRLACRERRAQEQPASARVDSEQHLQHEAADEPARLLLRLEHRSYHVFT